MKRLFNRLRVAIDPASIPDLLWTVLACAVVAAVVLVTIALFLHMEPAP